MNEDTKNLFFLQKINKLKHKIQKDLQKVQNIENIKKIEIEYTGKKGYIVVLLKEMQKMSLENKKKLVKKLIFLKKKLFR